MTRSAKDVIIKEISEHLGILPEQVKPESTLAELGADSLDVVELTMSIEDDLEIEVEALDNFTPACTVKDFMAAVLVLCDAKATA